MTQGEVIFRALRQRPLTYLGMLQLRAGLSPWKRLAEYLALHGKGWQLVKAKNARGLVVWRIRRAKGCA